MLRIYSSFFIWKFKFKPKRQLVFLDSVGCSKDGTMYHLSDMPTLDQPQSQSGQWNLAKCIINKSRQIRRPNANC